MAWILDLLGIDDDTKKDKKINYPLNPTKHEIRDVLSGAHKVSNGESIHAAADYLRKSKRTSEISRNPSDLKRPEERILKDYKRLISIESFEKKNQIGQGYEHRVFLDPDNKTVTKINNGYFYNFWKDYFNSLLLHNYLFQDTAYKLLGFTNENGRILPVVRQPYIEISEPTDTKYVKKFLFDNGFTSDEDIPYNYINKKLGITLEDLHTKNVLVREHPKTKETFLHFIDTVFRVLK